MAKKVLVLGAAGFIGSHLVKALKARGDRVIGVDKVSWPNIAPVMPDDYLMYDLSDWNACSNAMTYVMYDEIYNLAANMGGIGFISKNFSEICHENSRININVTDMCIQLAKDWRFPTVFFSSSACVYNQSKQLAGVDVTALREEDAYPAMSEKGYGWEKLYAEMLYQYAAEEHGVDIRIARFHNIYGPHGTYDGGREKAPSAACRKVAMARPEVPIQIWGDGEQTRSFCYIDDCVEGVLRLMASDVTQPINLGSSELVTINQLFRMVKEISGKDVEFDHDLSKPQGVRGRNSDNTLIKQLLGWEPTIPLRDGLSATYSWVYEQIHGTPPF